MVKKKTGIFFYKNPDFKFVWKETIDNLTTIKYTFNKIWGVKLLVYVTKSNLKYCYEIFTGLKKKREEKTQRFFWYF